MCQQAHLEEATRLEEQAVMIVWLAMPGTGGLAHLELLEDEGTDAAVAVGLLAVVAGQRKTELAAALGDDGGAHVGGHHDQRVLERNHAAAAVAQPSILQDL